MISSSLFRIGAVLFPRFELLDVFGPLELFGMLRGRVSITMLATSPGEIASDQGPGAVANARLMDELEFDLLLVPGGYGTRPLVEDDVFLDAIRSCARRSRLIASVCTGASVLAAAGLLDGRRATTNKIAYDWVLNQGSAVNWVRKARWITDGNVWTSSGVSAGMDMALAIIDKEFDRETALEAARQAEYFWHEDSTNDPFA